MNALYLAWLLLLRCWMNANGDLFEDHEPLRPKIEPFQFQNWTVYQKAVALVKASEPISCSAVKSGNRSLADQLRRASQSIVLNIAEGASRFTTSDKLSFLRIAKGSLFECVAAIDIAKELGILEEGVRRDFCDQATEIGKMLSGMMKAVSKARNGNSRTEISS